MGIIGATISNEVRMRNLRKMIPMSDDVRELFNEIAQTMHAEQKQVTLKCQIFLNIRFRLRSLLPK